MKIWFDTEFLDFPGPDARCELLSLGAVREDGETFYAENICADLGKANPWVVANVIPHLTGPAVTPLTIRSTFREFCGPVPEFWAYYGTHDWWLILQLFGGFMNLPSAWPQYFHDLQTAMLLKRRHNLPEHGGTAHNALEDALWTRAAYDYVMTGKL